MSKVIELLCFLCFLCVFCVNSVKTECLCSLDPLLEGRQCTQTTCYNERVAQDFCSSDFCVEASVRSEPTTDGNGFLAYRFRPVRVLRFSPASLAAIRPGLLYTSADDCGVRLRRGSIHILCGSLLQNRPLVSKCHFHKRQESLSLAERSFFISGFRKTSCPQKTFNASFLPVSFPPLPPLPPIPTFSPILTIPSLRPSLVTIRPPKNETKPSVVSSISAVSSTIAFQPSFSCVLIPINALALNRFLLWTQNKTSSAVDSSAQYLLQCPQRSFCLPQSHQLTQMANISVLPSSQSSSRTTLQPQERRLSSSVEFKAQMPRPLLPTCSQVTPSQVVMVPPWQLPSLDSMGQCSQSSCSDTWVDLDCDGMSSVVLSDGTRLQSRPLTDSSPTSVQTPDGSTIALAVGQSSRVTSLDGTEATLHQNGSSMTRLPDGTSVAVDTEHNVLVVLADTTRVRFDSEGMNVSLPEKTRVVTSEFGMLVTTADGKQTLIPTDSLGAEIHTKGVDIVVTEGLNADIRTKGGTQVLITPQDTTLGGRDGSSTNILPDGTVTVASPSGLSLVLSLDLYSNITTSDGTLVSLGFDDSLYVINENEAIVVFPNANSLLLTKDEIVSIESDSTVTITDCLGSNSLLPTDQFGSVCDNTNTCFE